jgi:transposase
MFMRYKYKQPFLLYTAATKKMTCNMQPQELWQKLHEVVLHLALDINANVLKVILAVTEQQLVVLPGASDDLG